VRAVELICVLVVIAAVIGFFVWFLFLATGGPGPGTV
jgi:nitrate reductase NapE component